MPGPVNQHADFEPLREGLRRASAVAGFALRMARENAPVPPGIVSDFLEARGAIEREFVRVHLQLSPDLRKRLKELILKTKGLTPEVMAKGAEALAERLRGVLNDLMIDGGMSLSLTEEIFDKAEHETSANLTQGVAHVLTKPAVKERPRPPERGFSKIIAGALVVLLIVACAVGAWGLGLFDDPIPLSNRGGISATDSAPPGNATQNKPPTDSGENSGPFDRNAAGYSRSLRAQPLRPVLDPLNPDVDLSKVLTSEWPLLALGLEELVYAIEPNRLKLPPDETRRRVDKFSTSAEKSEGEWIAARKKFLDAFIDHVREQLQLATFNDGPQVLLSDVLSAKGGPRLPLLLAYLTLARACNADLALIAPMGIDYSLLSQRIKAGTATFDGDQLGLRPTPGGEAKLNVLLAALCERLRPTLTDANARAAISAVILRSSGQLDARQAREALADLDLAFFAEPTPRDPLGDIRPILTPAAKLLEPAICAALLDPSARGDAGEAARLLDLAYAAKDAPSADKALLLLGERAEKGALYKEEPLAYVVARLLLKRGDKTGAAQWFKRAMAEFPDHWQSAVDFAAATEDPAQKRTLLEAAYARGCRTPDFLRGLAKIEASAGENVAALAALDEVLALEIATATDVKEAALICLSLEKPKWAQERIAASKFASEPELLRIDLICELAQNGLSDRAKELAKTYGKRGTDDPYIESLLQRFGG